MTKKLVLPASGVPATVQISSFPEERKWKEDVPAIASNCPEAVSDGDGKIYLAERASFPKSFLLKGRDSVIEIMVDGKLAYRDKAKYKEARGHGVKWCRNGFYVDIISK